MFAALDSSDPDGASSCFAEDAQFVVGNAAPIIGREGIRAAMREFTGLVAGSRHAPLRIWEVPSPGSPGPRVLLICEMTVEYTKHGGDTVSVTSCNVFELVDEAIVVCRAYMDLAPLFG